MAPLQKVLFLCTGNSCRSQMAEGFLRELGGDRFESFSAGMNPSGETHPLAVKAMEEVGIDITTQRPKGVEEFLGKEWIKWLIIVCNKAKQSCPRVWPMLADENRLYWPLDDPAEATGSEEERMQVFRRVRDEIRMKIEAWLSETQD